MRRGDFLTQPYPAYARIYYVPKPWRKPVIEGETIKETWGDSSAPVRFDRWHNPLVYDPVFWKKVRQLYFTVQERNKARIRAFYEQYGDVGTQLGPNPVTNPRSEYIPAVEAALDWFRELTIRFEQIKARRAAPLWEWFNEAEHRWPYRWVLFERGDWQITFPLLRKVVGLVTGSDAEELGPANDDELFAASWLAVRDAISDHFHRFVVHPEAAHYTGPVPHPLSDLLFVTSTALGAAFLQWYFQEVSGFNVSTCEAEDCNNPVLPPRHAYCSERCRQRVKKRRQRARRKGGPDHG